MLPNEWQKLSWHEKKGLILSLELKKRAWLDSYEKAVNKNDLDEAMQNYFRLSEEIIIILHNLQSDGQLRWH